MPDPKKPKPRALGDGTLAEILAESRALRAQAEETLRRVRELNDKIGAMQKERADRSDADERTRHAARKKR